MFFPTSQLIFNFLTSSNFLDPILATAKSIGIVLSKKVTIPFATFCITWSTLQEFRITIPKRGSSWNNINLHERIEIWFISYELVNWFLNDPFTHFEAGYWAFLGSSVRSCLISCLSHSQIGLLNSVDSPKVIKFKSVLLQIALKFLEYSPHSCFLNLYLGSWFWNWGKLPIPVHWIHFFQV